MADTSISWADKVWNPMTGCTKVSEGCRNCYAERMSKRLAGRCGYPAENPFAVTLHPDKLEEPLRWKKPSRIFVCSMGDLFHEAVPFEYIAAIFGVIAAAPRHTFMVLTKRPERIQPFLKWIARMGGHIQTHRVPEIGACVDALHYYARALFNSKFFAGDEVEWLPRNLILGTSVENQPTADERLKYLMELKAIYPYIKIFASYEPAIGPVDFESISPGDWRLDVLRGLLFVDGRNEPANIPKLDLLIMGGESGPGARPLHPDWARSTRDQCKAAGVPFFFKQWGEWGPRSQITEDCVKHFWATHQRNMGPWGTVDSKGRFHRNTTPWNGHDDDGNGEAVVLRVGKKAAGCLLDGKEHKELP